MSAEALRATEVSFRNASSLFHPLAHSFVMRPNRSDLVSRSLSMKPGFVPISWQGATFEAHNEGLEYGRTKISELVRHRCINTRAAVRALRVLANIQLPAFVFPHVSADEEGEVLFLWVAGGMTVEISIPDVGEAYLRITDEDGLETEVGFYRWLPNWVISESLSRLSDRVVEANPQWRHSYS